jgi:hypothetical protein
VFHWQFTQMSSPDGNRQLPLVLRLIVDAAISPMDRQTICTPLRLFRDSLLRQNAIYSPLHFACPIDSGSSQKRHGCYSANEAAHTVVEWGRRSVEKGRSVKPRVSWQYRVYIDMMKAAPAYGKKGFAKDSRIAKLTPSRSSLTWCRTASAHFSLFDSAYGIVSQIVSSYNGNFLPKYAHYFPMCYSVIVVLPSTLDYPLKPLHPLHKYRNEDISADFIKYVTYCALESLPIRQMDASELSSQKTKEEEVTLGEVWAIG